ncbi:hypothetical protein DFJ58DRAFT_837489 [Suillus subalutaceus]|uniref:uncharacterized protein n=1 Tax=Suillus subalutaceus TaxID=48586 RepID=UPI001B865FFD|nr:uncharacterized protein DFJ58DRAFT_837489 [Suillus subalutaceus]KAG1870089.1 hypothetical protein DFJ58DRAFT_837489 [Suillus subalutaceus]
MGPLLVSHTYLAWAHLLGMMEMGDDCVLEDDCHIIRRQRMESSELESSSELHETWRDNRNICVARRGFVGSSQETFGHAFDEGRRHTLLRSGCCVRPPENPAGARPVWECVDHWSSFLPPERQSISELVGKPNTLTASSDGWNCVHLTSGSYCSGPVYIQHGVHV